MQMPRNWLALARLRAGRATWWALPCISSFLRHLYHTSVTAVGLMWVEVASVNKVKSQKATASCSNVKFFNERTDATPDWTVYNATACINDSEKNYAKIELIVQSELSTARFSSDTFTLMQLLWAVLSRKCHSQMTNINHKTTRTAH